MCKIEDIKYMKRALELAAMGRGYTKTNPMVGAVIVYEDKIIGEGYHRVCGEAHAEVNAVNSVKNRELLALSTMYVTLEPCSHWGKTPPCAELIIKCGIKKVVIAVLDSFSKVNGRGVKMLKDSGVDVEIGVLEKEAWELNRRFFISNAKKRPYIILKWAQTCDGFLDNDREDSAPMSWLTGVQCKKMVHKLRAAESAIMVGSNTVRRDNPSLTVREWSGDNPIRVVIDRDLKLSSDYAIFDQSAPTIVFNRLKNEGNFVAVNFEKDDFLDEILNYLFQKGVTSLIVEGGAQILNLFIEREIYDESIVFYSPLLVAQLEHGRGGEGVKVPYIPRKGKVTTQKVGGVMVSNTLFCDAL